VFSFGRLSRNPATCLTPKPRDGGRVLRRNVAMFASLGLVRPSRLGPSVTRYACTKYRNARVLKHAPRADGSASIRVRARNPLKRGAKGSRKHTRSRSNQSKHLGRRTPFRLLNPPQVSPGLPSQVAVQSPWSNVTSPMLSAHQHCFRTRARSHRVFVKITPGRNMRQYTAV